MRLYTRAPRGAKERGIAWFPPSGALIDKPFSFLFDSPTSILLTLYFFYSLACFYCILCILYIHHFLSVLVCLYLSLSIWAFSTTFRKEGPGPSLYNQRKRKFARSCRLDLQLLRDRSHNPRILGHLESSRRRSGTGRRRR